MDEEDDRLHDLLILPAVLLVAGGAKTGKVIEKWAPDCPTFKKMLCIKI